MEKLFELLKVAGVSFSFDPAKPSGERVTPGSVTVGREPLALDKTYRLSINDYIANGKDGYDCLLGSEILVNDEDGPQLSTVVQNHFQTVNHLNGLRKFKYYHHQSIIYRSERRSLSKQTKDSAHDSTKDQKSQSAEDDNSDEARSFWKKARMALSFARRLTIDEAETKEREFALAPKVQERIKNLGSGSV